MGLTFYAHLLIFLFSLLIEKDHKERINRPICINLQYVTKPTFCSINLNNPLLNHAESYLVNINEWIHIQTASAET